MENKGLRVGKIVDKEGIMTVKMLLSGKFMKGRPTINGEKQPYRPNHTSDSSISVQNQNSHTINDIAEVAPG
jgi:hypothetical protein